MSSNILTFSSGVYTPRQAARLVGAKPRDVLRWTRGSGPSEPIWRAHYQGLDDTTEISFLDLIEVRVVSALRREGATLQAIRYAIQIAKNEFRIERPLASQKFYLSGTEILMDAVEGDGQLVSLSKRRPTQKVFKRIIEQNLEDVEYEDDVAARWRPNWVSGIVLDPKRQFGNPILDDFGLSTETIRRELENELTEREISSLYEVPLDLVKAAKKFELRLEENLAAA
ncbi:MAG: hypothetical protein AAGF78_10200 [Pseudomonadota bacterium]